MVWSPVFYKLYLSNDKILLKRYETRIFNLISLLIILISLIFYFLVPLLNQSFADREFVIYLKSSHELSLLFLGYLLTVPWWIAQNYFHINNAGNDLMKINLVFGSIALVIWFLCIYFFSTIGIYIGFALQAFVKSLGIYFYSSRKWGVKQPVLVIFISSVVFLLMLLL
jgi:O-antigen/teichoic acid export membrane protein